MQCDTFTITKDEIFAVSTNFRIIILSRFAPKNINAFVNVFHYQSRTMTPPIIRHTALSILNMIYENKTRGQARGQKRDENMIFRSKKHIINHITGFQVCVEEILYYHIVNTSDFFIDMSHTFNRTLRIVHSIFVNIVQESQGLFLHVHVRREVAQGSAEEYFFLIVPLSYTSNTML